MPKKKKVTSARPRPSGTKSLQKKDLNCSTEKKKKENADHVPVSSINGQKKTRASKKESEETAQKSKVQNKSNEIRELPVETESLVNISAVEKVNCWLQSCVEEPENVSSNSSIELWREEATDILHKRQAELFPEEFYENLCVPIPLNKGAAKNINKEDRKAFFAKLNLGSSHQFESEGNLDSDEDALSFTHTGTQTDAYSSTARTQSNFQTECETETQSYLQTATLCSSKQPFSSEYDIKTQSNLQTASQSNIQTRNQSFKTDSCMTGSKTSKNSNQHYKNTKIKARRYESPQSSGKEKRNDNQSALSQAAKKRCIQQEQTQTVSLVFKVPRSPKKGRIKAVNVPKTSTRLYGDETNLDEESLPLSDIRPVKAGKATRRSSKVEDINKGPKTPQKKEKKNPKPKTSTRLFIDTDYTDDITDVIPCLSSIRTNEGKTVTEQTPNKPTKTISPKRPRKGLRAKSAKSKPASLSKLFDNESQETENVASRFSSNDHAGASPLETNKGRVKTSTPKSKEDGGQKFEFEIDISSVNNGLSDESSIGLYIEPSSREVNSQEIVCPSESMTLIEMNNDELFKKKLHQSFNFIRQPQIMSFIDNHKDQTCGRDISKSFHLGRRNINSTPNRFQTSKQPRVWVSKQGKLSMEDFKKLPVSFLPFYVKKNSMDQREILISNDKSFICPEDVPIDILCLL